jgi:hypothetical protein
MSLLLSKKHLRVEIPQTIDGKNLLYDDNRLPVMKTVFLAQKGLLKAISLKDQKNYRQKLLLWKVI